MRKVIFVILAVSALVFVLSSCTVNAFKPLNSPTSIMNASKDALAAANNGDSQTALRLSTAVISTVAGTQVSNTEDLYEALTSSSTSSKEVIEKTAVAVNEVKAKLLSGSISSESTEGIAVKNAALAMERSVLKVKNIGLTDTLSKIFAMLQSSSTTTEVKSQFTTINATSMSQLLTLAFSLTTDMPTMNLMGNLCGLLGIYGGNGAFNWNVANALYDVLYNLTALFDSNGNGKLDPNDEVFKYIWDYKHNRFKTWNEISSDPDNIKGIDEIQIATFNNLSLSKKVVQKLNDANIALEAMSENVPPSLQNYADFIYQGEKYLNEICDKTSASSFSKLKTVMDLALYIAKSVEEGK